VAALAMSRVALVVPPLLRVPPLRYAGTERVVATLGQELHRRGHQVTLIGPGDADVPYRIIPTVPEALWPAGFRGDPAPFFRHTVEVVAAHRNEFDVVHSHLEEWLLPLAGEVGVPIVTTFHGRLDLDPVERGLRDHPRAPLIAISSSQRRWYPEARWVATVPHGLPFPDRPVHEAPDGHLALVGRATHEKGIAEAIAVARTTGRPLTIAAKAYAPEEVAFVDEVIKPAVKDRIATFLGEVTGDERDELLACSSATLMLGAWPEPFGLVAIESMALGTPVIARRAGALPEIVEHGVDGFLVDDVAEAIFALDRLPSLDRRAIARRARSRFSTARMADRYADAYARAVGEAQFGRFRAA
jgi:glycosyltransferase involved in cell wall biosynthesis